MYYIWVELFCINFCRCEVSQVHIFFVLFCFKFVFLFLNYSWYRFIFFTAYGCPVSARVIENSILPPWNYLCTLKKKKKKKSCNCIWVVLCLCFLICTTVIFAYLFTNTTLSFLLQLYNTLKLNTVIFHFVLFRIVLCI